MFVKIWRCNRKSKDDILVDSYKTDTARLRYYASGLQHSYIQVSWQRRGFLKSRSPSVETQTHTVYSENEN